MCPPAQCELVAGTFESCWACWIFLPFLCPVSFGICMDFQQPHSPHDREHSSLIRGWIKKCLFLFPLSFHSMPPHHCTQSLPFTFYASFSVVFCRPPSSINSFPSWQSLVYLTTPWMQLFSPYLWSLFLSCSKPFYFSFTLFEMQGNKTDHITVVSCILNFSPGWFSF